MLLLRFVVVSARSLWWLSVLPRLLVMLVVAQLLVMLMLLTWPSWWLLLGVRAHTCKHPYCG